MALVDGAGSDSFDSQGADLYRLGLPFWGLSDWIGGFYPKGSKPGDFLGHYASVFGSVEGNTTFYSLPSEASVDKWRHSTPESFAFCFKLPKLVTHEKGLLGTQEDVATFFERLAPLGPRLGPFLIQLPPSFGPDRLVVLDRFLSALPGLRAPLRRHGAEPTFAVELRQIPFYQPPLAHEVDALLAEHGCDRCLIDTRALRDGDASHPEVAAARHRKPDLPAPPVAVGGEPMLRFIGHPDFHVSDRWIDFWVPHVAGWIGEGRKPHIFVHLPDNKRAPQLARRFHDRLRRELESIDPLPPFPAEAEPSQMSLF